MSALAQHPLIALVAIALAGVVGLAPVLRGAISDRRDAEIIRYIIKECGNGSPEFKQFAEVLKSRANSPP